MTQMDGQALTEIEALVEERQRFERWIDALAERRSITPSHVYHRVLEDYRTRMQRVSESLAGRAGDIRAAIKGLEDQMQSVQEEESATSDTRAEAELRAAVGEYTQDQWEEIRAVSDENITRLSGIRLGVASELANLQRILAVAVPAESGGAAAPAPMDSPPLRSHPPVSHPHPAPEAAEIVTPPASDAPTSVAVKSSATDTSGDFDELGFLNSVVDTRTERQQAAASTDRGVTPPRQFAVEGDPSMDRAMRAPTPAASKIVRSATPLITESLSAAANDQREEQRARLMLEKRLSGSVPAYLKDVNKEATKSLKCAECGTLNFPTEWYCERCGGELAAF